MEVKVIGEYGYEQALFGNGFSFGKTSEMTFQQFLADKELTFQMEERAKKLAPKDGGHNKFLEHIIVWLDIDAPMYLWKQYDTYRHTSKLSESTMHTLMKRPLETSDFNDHNVDIELLIRLNERIAQKDFDYANNNLPQSFLQRRTCCTSYKTLRNIISQRKGHKLPQWKQFIDSVLSGVQHPELLEG